MRSDGRKKDQLRPVKISRNFIPHAEGSVLIEMGNTKVICTATLENRVPSFLRDKGKGWVTAEYAMLPRSTQQRFFRESTRGKIGGRTHEIQRLIGRSLRAVMNLEGLGERTVWIDCDVIQADGGTRTASITGSFIALTDAMAYAKKNGLIEGNPLQDYLAAVSVGKVDGEILMDLTYAEDSQAEVDLNVVMTGKGQFVEVQGTAEAYPFSREELNRFISLAQRGIKRLVKTQRKLLGELF